MFRKFLPLPVAAAFLASTAAHAENWVDAGSYSLKGNSIQVFVDTHSRRQIGTSEYVILSQERYTYPQTSAGGKVYTTSLTLSRVRCDIRAIRTMKLTLVNGEGQTVFDPGEALSDRLPTTPARPGSMGYGIVRATCGTE